MGGPQCPPSPGIGCPTPLALTAVRQEELGTAISACPESAATAAYRTALLQQPPVLTALTAVISGRPARGLVNRFMLNVDQPGRL